MSTTNTSTTPLDLIRKYNVEVYVYEDIFHKFSINDQKIKNVLIQYQEEAFELYCKFWDSINNLDLETKKLINKELEKRDEYKDLQKTTAPISTVSGAWEYNDDSDSDD